MNVKLHPSPARGSGGAPQAPLRGEKSMPERVLEENRRLHALESAHYLDRHPEQTNAYQGRILTKTLDALVRRLNRPGAVVLDAGCGTGYLTRPLLERGFEVIGVDVSATLAEVLGRSIPREYRNRVQLRVEDIATFLNRKPGPFDAVTCSALLHHLYDYEPAVRGMCRRLKPGGMLLIFFEPLRQEIRSPGRFALHRLLARMDEWLYGRLMHRRGVPLIEDEHGLADYQRRFGGIDADRLAALVEGCGCEIVEIKKYCVRRLAPAAFIANNILGTANTFHLLAQKI